MSDFAHKIGTDQVQALRLSDLLTYVRNTIKGAFGGYYWIIAEVTSLSVRRHYYFDLAEMQNGQVVAKVRGNLWESVASRVIPKFKASTGQPPQEGMELMLLVQVDMHLQYGISLTIYDINPDYTLGNLERKRKETIRQLQADGVMDLNKHNPLPQLLQRVAVITSETAAGWGDFQNQIEQSGLGSLFRIDLYPALMQGNKTTATVYQAMIQILGRVEDYDALLILRGGGSRMDLAAFDDYELCSYISNFPLPVLTAIGHEQDVSIADMVAHTRLKTPTALAEFLVQRMLLQLNRIVNAEQGVERLLLDRMGDLEKKQSYVVSVLQHQLRRFEQKETARLNDFSQNLISLVHTSYADGLQRIKYTSLRSRSLLSEYIIRMQQQFRTRLRDHESLLRRTKIDLERQGLQVRHIESDISKLLMNLIPTQEERLQYLSRVANLYDPSNTMKRGFVPILKNDTPVTHTKQLQGGDTVRILLLDGEAEAMITTIKEHQTSNGDE